MRYVVTGYVPHSISTEFKACGRTNVRIVCRTREQAEKALEARKHCYTELHIIEEPTDLLVVKR